MKNQFLLFAIAICAFASCDDNNGNDNGGLTGDVDTFTVNCNFETDWETSVFRLNTSAGDWFSYSPQSGKAGNQRITFKVRTDNRVLDYSEIEFNIADRFDTDEIAYITLNAEDYELGFEGKVITEIDLSTWKGIEGVPLAVSFYDVPNLETVWLKHGEQEQNIDIDDEGKPWTIKYK
jgi:hypothetical protein